MGYALSQDETNELFSARKPSPMQPVTAAPSRQSATAQPVVSEAMLDNLMRMESGGDPKAYNKKTGATGAYQFTPITMRQFKKMGLTVDPRDPVSSRAGAKALLELYARESGGDLDAALTRYGGFKTKDPAAYLAGVRGDSSRPEMASTAPLAASPADPGMTSLFGEGMVPEWTRGYPDADQAAAALAGGIHGYVEPFTATGQMAGAVPGLGAVSDYATGLARELEEVMRPAKEAYPDTTAIGEGIGQFVNPLTRLVGKAGPAAKIGEVETGAARGMISTASQMGTQGAISGLFTPVTQENESLAVEKFKQGVTGGVFGVLGGSAIKGLGGVGAWLNPSRLSSQAAEHIATLKKWGVSLDVPQFTQNPAYLRMKAAWFDNPATTGAAQEAQSLQRREFTRAVSRTMGEDTDNITASVLSAAKDRLGNNYALLQSKYGAKIDSSVMKDIRHVQADALRAMEDGNYALFKRHIDFVIDKTNTNSGKWQNGLSGAQLKQVQYDLGLLKKDPQFAEYAQRLSGYLETAHGKNITNLVDKDLLRRTNQQYGNYKAIEDVAPRDTMGLVSPSKIYNYVAGRGKKYLYYREDDDLSKLAQAGKEILEQKLPNSGTLARIAAQNPYLSKAVEFVHKKSQQKYGGLTDTDPTQGLTKDMGQYLTQASDLIPRPGVASQIAANKLLEAQNEEYRQQPSRTTPMR